MENLKALVYKGDLTPYQRALAQREFKDMVERLELLEKAVKNNAVSPHVSVSLRDYIATECMKSEIIAWNKEMSNEYRTKLLEDMIERYGNIKVNDAIALMSYEMADAMLSARSNER